MRKNYFKRTLLYIGVTASVLITSCNSSQQLIDPKLSLNAARQGKDPSFIKDIALNSNNTKSITIKSENKHSLKNELGPCLANTLQSKYAGLLGVVPQAISNFSLYNFIEEWYGVRYRLGGNDKKGIDCSAFVQRLYESVFCTNLVRTAFEQFKTCHLVWNTDSLKEGDLVFFHTRGRKRISHVGIYLANNFFVHASSTQGVMISSLNEQYWSRFYAGAGKIRDEERSL